MSKKVLFCANIDLHLLGFHTPYMGLFRDNGWQVFAAAKKTLDVPLQQVDHQIDLPVSRNPYSPDNIVAQRQLRELIESEHIDLVHCHTPTGAAVARFAARAARKRGCYVIYTAHGFHFFKGSPRQNWALYYPVERSLARITDMLITTNQEYNELASNRFTACDNVHKVPGVGFDTERFSPVSEDTRRMLRAERGVSEDEEVLIYAASLYKDKNHAMLLRALARLAPKRPNLRLYLLGRGYLAEKIDAMASELGISDRVTRKGYVQDVNEWMRLSDVVVSVSRREGMGMNIVEAMACGKPVVATRIRGHVDTVEHGVSGYLADVGDDVSFANYIERALEAPQSMRDAAARRALNFSRPVIMQELAQLYSAATGSPIMPVGPLS